MCIYIHHLANPANRVPARSWIVRSNRRLWINQNRWDQRIVFSELYFLSLLPFANYKLEIYVKLEYSLWMPLWNIRVFKLKLRASLINIDQYQILISTFPLKRDNWNLSYCSYLIQIFQELSLKIYERNNFSLWGTSSIFNFLITFFFRCVHATMYNNVPASLYYSALMAYLQLHSLSLSLSFSYSLSISLLFSLFFSVVYFR